MKNKKEIKRLIKNAIENTQSMHGAARSLGINYKTLRKYAKEFNLFNPNQSGKGMIKSKIKTEDILNNKLYIRSDALKKRLLKEGYFEYKCIICNITEWMGEPIILELDHIDGKNKNNNLTNLRLLCPNCHSQTLTFRGRNLKNNQNKYDDNDIIEHFKNSNNIYQLCKKLNICSKGGNYKTIKNKLDKLNLYFTDIKIDNKFDKKNYCKCGKEIGEKSKMCEECYYIYERKVKRPSYKQLLKDVKKLGNCGTGRKYGVSEASVRKWIKIGKKDFGIVI